MGGPACWRLVNESGTGMGSCQDAYVPVTFAYQPLGAGWATSSLDIDGESVTVRLSYMSPRAPEDFLDAVLALFYGARISWVSWMEEPAYHRWKFTQGEERLVQVTVLDTDYDDPWLANKSSVRIRFATEIALAELANAVVVGFEDMLQGYSEKKYRRNWAKDGLAGLRERVEELAAIVVEGPRPAVPKRLYRNIDRVRSSCWASDLFLRRPSDPPATRET
jgi:hypothetical protein